MEILLAIIVFGLLIAGSVYGLMESQRSARERERGNFASTHTMAMTAGRRGSEDEPRPAADAGPTSPRPPAEPRPAEH